MDQDTRQANVVLTADTAEYSRSVQQASRDTGTLSQSVDTLSKKLSDLSKSAGKKLLIISAADVATITAATAAYGSFEKQMSQLNAQSAVLNKTVSGQKETFAGFTSSVQTLRREFPTTTAAAADLVQTLSKFQTAGQDITRLSQIFMKAQGATGESATAIAQSMLQLQKQMGTSTTNTQKFTDQVVTLAARTQTSAVSLTDFASSLAPIAKVAGMTQTQVMGVSAAFARAGQDGYYAANTYTKMLSDVTNAIQSGSPDLAKYANLIGVTTDQFKTMGSSEGVTRIFEQINRMGPDAIQTLNRLGYDGMRSMRSITAVANQGGGIRGAMQEAQNAYGNNATNRGAAGGFGGISDSLQKLGTQLKMFAEGMGSTFAPAIDGFVKGMTKGMEAVNAFMNGPAGKLLQWAVAIAAPIAAVAGGLLALAPALLKVAAVGTIFRGAPAMGLRDALRGNIYDRGSNTFTTLPGARDLSKGGVRVAEGSANFPSRWGYAAGNTVGALRYGSLPGQVADPAERALMNAGRAPLWQRAAAIPIRGTAAGLNLMSDAYSPGTISGYNDFTQRSRLFNRSYVGDYFRPGQGGAGQFDRFRGFAQNAGHSAAGPAFFPMPMAGGSMAAGAGAAESATAAAAKEVSTLGKAASVASKEAGPLARSFTTLTSASGRFMAVLASNLGTGIGMAGRAGAGLAGAIGINPYLLAGGAAAFGVYELAKHTGDHTKDVFDPKSAGVLQQYSQATGQTGQSMDLSSLLKQNVVPTANTKSDATTLTPTEIAYAQSSGYDYTNPDITKYKGNYKGWETQVLGEMTYSGSLNPQAIADVVNDTVKMFGPTAGQSLAAKLSQNNYKFSATDFVGLITSAKSNEARGKATSNYVKVLQDRQAASLIAGPDAASQTQLADLNKSVLSATGLGSNPDDIKQLDRILQNTFKKSSFSLSGQYAADQDKGISASQEQQLNAMGFYRDTKNPQQFFNAQGQTPEAAGFNMPAPKAYEIPQNPAARQKAIYSSYIGGMSDSARQDFVTEHKDILSPTMSVDQIVAAVIKAGTAAPASDIYKSVQDALHQQFALTPYKARTALDPLANSDVVNAMTKDDPNLSYKAMITTIRGLRNTRGLIGTAAALQQGVSARGDNADPASLIYQGGLGLIQQYSQNQATYQSRPQAFQQQTGVIQAQLHNLSYGQGDPEQQQKQLQYQQQITDLVAQQYQYYKSIAMTVREFNVSRARAEEDFSLNRARMEEDYNTSRERALADYNLQRKQSQFDFDLARKRSDFDFNLQRDRNQANFDRSMGRNTKDFYLSRTRAEQDFNHQVQIMSEQSAQQMYSVYERVEVKRTQDAGVLMTNATDQLQQMREQEANLERLRKMGVSDTVIQQMGLTDPNNAQQLARFLSDLQDDPRLVQQFNKNMRSRVKAATGIITDESSTDWQEMTRQYNLSRERGYADFQRSQRRSKADFARSMMQAQDDYQRSLGRQEDDYTRMMDRQQTQFDTTMSRGEKDYNKTIGRMVDDYGKQMDRASEDLSRMATDINGSFEKILRQAISGLSGSARKQARAVLQQFREVKPDILTVGGSIQSGLEKIFGVNFKSSTTPNQAGQVHNTPGEMQGQHGGGSAPRTTPIGAGRTTRKEAKKDSPEVIFWPVPKAESSVGRPFGFPDPQYATGHHTGQDFPAPYGTPIFAIMDGEVESTAWGGAYGNLTKLYHGKNDQDQMVETWYAHQSRQDVRSGDEVDGGKKIGAVGETGNAQGTHLHLEYRLDGQYVDPMKLLQGKGVDIVDKSGHGVIGEGSFSVSDFLNTKRPKLERAVSQITMGSGYKEGDWSHKVNAMAIKGLRKAAIAQGTTLHSILGEWGTGSDPSSPKPGSVGTAPGHPTGNAKIGMEMAAARGWKGKQWDALYKLWMGESGWNEHADNPTSSAYGIPQALMSLHKLPRGYFDRTSGSGSNMQGYGGDPRVQIGWGLNYIKSSYGDPLNALGAWEARSPHWYGEGGVFGSPNQIGIAERGPEVVLPLDHRGAEFIATLMSRMGVGNEAKGINARGSIPANCSHSTYNYKIDKSSRFSGPIYVKADDPRKFLQELKAQQRNGALSAPSLQGSAI